MRFQKLIGQIILASPLFASSKIYARPSEHIVTKRFEDVSKTISWAIETYGARNVLLALDIDNTTLEFENDLGSEHWFLWQSELLQETPMAEGAVARNINDVLEIQSHIISQSSMHPVEPRIPVDLRKFGRQGVKMLALTSRGLSMHDATLREIQNNKFPYAAFAPGPHQGFPGTFKPYDIAKPEDSGLTPEDIQKFALKEPADVAFDRGVFLTAGQHKGIMLRTLLNKTGERFDAIIFVDDRQRHSQGLQAAFKDRPELVSTIQYTHTAERIEKFHQGDKHDVKRDWCTFAKSLRTTMGKNWGTWFYVCPTNL